MVAVPGFLMGQGFFPRQANPPAGRLIEPPRSLQQRLREAEVAIKENRPSDAVLALGDLVAREIRDSAESDLVDQDFFLDNEDAKEGNPATESLMRTARKMIGQMDTSGWDAYQLRFGPIAARLLEQAAPTRDWEAVEKVRRCYLHTLAGYQATALLAQREIYRGHSLAASLLLDDVVQVPRAVNHLGPEIVLMHAVARHDAARPLLEIEQTPVAGLFFDKRLTVRANRDDDAFSGDDGSTAESNADPSLTFASMDDLKLWLAGRSKTDNTYQPSMPTDHPMFGSSADRNGNSAGQMPLSNLRWALPTTASHLQEKMVREYTNELATSGNLPPPSWTPLRIGDQLLMRTTERLVGVDYKTGKRVWTYPWQSGLETVEDEEVLFNELSPDQETDSRISGRIFNDLPYGQISSDGERAFMLTDLSDLKLVTFSQMMIRGTRSADGRSNTLVALEMKTEGKLLWRIGQNGDPASPLANAFFLGPPLPLDGRLYVMAELSGDLLLCCLDPANGREIWRQHLVAIESGGIDTDAIRRVSGAMPTHHAGMLICPTGAGACVAIDLIDRMLVWGAVYNRSHDMTRVTNRRRGLEPSKLMNRWDNGIAIGSGTKVLVTPPETDRLFGFHLLSGKPLFQYKNRVKMRYLAGIRGDKFILVGADQLRAYDLNSGSLVWSSPQDFLSAGQHIAGRGIFGDGDYIVPTTTGELVRVSTETGEVLQRRSTRYPLGNLVAIDGDIIVQGSTQLSVAFGEKTLEPMVNRRLAENPDDFDAMVRMSELLIQKGKRREALDLLKRAREMQADNDEVHLLSVSAMLGMLRDDPDTGEEYIEDLIKLIDRPSQQMELLSLRLRGATQNKDWVTAIEHAMDLSNLLAKESPMDSVVQEIISSPTRWCKLECWLATRVAEIRSECDVADLDTINQRIRTRSIAQLENSNQTLANWVRHFDGWQGIADARDVLAGRYRDEKQWLASEQVMLGPQTMESLMKQASPEETVDASLTDPESLRRRMLGLSEVFLAGGLYEDALAMLTSMNQVQDVQRDADRSDQTSVDAMLRQAFARTSEHRWPESVSMNWQSQNLGGRLGISNRLKSTSPTVVVSGNHFKDWQLSTEINLPMSMRNPMGLTRPIAAEGLRGNENRDNEALISGGAMIVTTPSGLLCVDLYQMLAGDASVRWRHAFGGDGGGTANSSPLSNPLGDRIYRRRFNTATASPVQSIPELSVGPIVGDRCFVLQGGDLIALDILTGGILWRNSDAPKNGVVVSDGAQVAVVSDASDQIAFFHFGDGRSLKTDVWTGGKLWKATGKHILCYSSGKEPKTYEMKLLDPFAGEVRLQQESFGVNRTNSNRPSGMGRVVDGRYLLWMQSDGQALVWDIVSGTEISRPKLPAYDNLVGFNAMRLGERFLFLPKLKLDSSKEPGDREVATTSNVNHQTVHAVFAVNQDDGELAWSREFDEPWGCTLDQASATPLLMLTRSPYITSVSTTVRKKYLDVLALGIQDGQTVKERLGKAISSNNNQLQTESIVQPARNIVLVKIGNDEQVTFKFGVDEKDSVAEETEEGTDEAFEKLKLELQLRIPKPKP